MTANHSVRRHHFRTRPGPASGPDDCTAWLISEEEEADGNGPGGGRVGDGEEGGVRKGGKRFGCWGIGGGNEGWRGEEWKGRKRVTQEGSNLRP